jgi:L-amino acid N-acyltransferase YncA
MIIHRATAQNIDEIWDIFHSIVKAGDTYTFSPDISKDDAMAYWMGADKHCYVAIVDGKIAGTFIIKDNQEKLGAHIANASYMVAPNMQGKSFGRQMAEFSLEEARRLGYYGMQFNIVVSTNVGAIRLWQNLGFEIIGTIPDAFNQKDMDHYVDAHIMYKKL